MGVVWAAQNEATLREVALKLLPMTDPTLRARLLREARACGQLRHRNVVEVLDVETAENGDPFLVMELLAGETLAQRLKRLRRLGPAEAAQIARDVSRALAAAHARRIIHRDLKPANIFLQDDEAGTYVVKVLDFGVSKDLATSDGLNTTAGAAVGSLAYMSPEQARAAPDIDHRTDLWAVGVVLFEMLAGERPLKGAPQIILSLARGDVPQLARVFPGVDPGLAAVVDRCLRPRREDRIGSAQEIAALLEPYAATAARASISNEALPAPPAAPAPPAPPAAPAAHSSPDLLLGAGGTVRMNADHARRIQQALAARPAPEDSATVPLRAKSAPPLPSGGPNGTELMLPTFSMSPQPTSPRPPPPAPLPPPAQPLPAAASAAPAPAPRPPARAASPTALLLIGLVAAVIAAMLAVLAYALLVGRAPWE